MLRFRSCFSGDPAFYKLDKKTGRVIEDNVKRLSVLSSIGDNFANWVKAQDLMDTSFNISTFDTQKFASVYYASLVKWHTDIHTKEFKESNPELSDEEIATKVKAIVDDTLNEYNSLILLMVKRGYPLQCIGHYLLG